MNNKKTLKSIVIFMLIVLIGSWIIPATTFSGYDFTKGQITPVGLWDFFASFATTLQYFYQPGFLIIAIGALYGILIEIGVIEKLKASVKKTFKGKERLFIVMTISFFMLVSSLTSMYLPLLVFVPFFMAAILGLGYNKKLALAATVGSIVLGYAVVFFNAPVNQTVVAATKITFLNAKAIILPLFILVTSVVFTYNLKSKKVSKEEDVSKYMLMDETKTAKDLKVKSIVPFIIVAALSFILLILGVTPFEAMLKTTIFTDFHTWLVGLKIGEYAIVKNVLGVSLPVLNYFQLTDVIIILVFTMFGLVLAYRMSWKDVAPIVIRGAKKALPIALVAIFINIVVVFALNTQYLATVMQWLMGVALDTNKALLKINVTIPVISNIFDWLVSVVHMLFVIVTTFIGSLFVVDNIYVANYTMPMMAGLVGDTMSKEVLGFVAQIGYAFAMLVGPSSIALLAGLFYLEIPYKTWLKYIWKAALILLGFAVVVATIVAKL